VRHRESSDVGTRWATAMDREGRRSEVS
jgi:hypothetical protein